jgi:hypothetical protein
MISLKMESFLMIKSPTPLNESIRTHYNQQLNKQAAAREHFLSISTNFSVNNADSVKIQASTLSKLTEVPSELTRNTAVSIICYFCLFGIC